MKMEILHNHDWCHLCRQRDDSPKLSLIPDGTEQYLRACARCVEDVFARVVGLMALAAEMRDEELVADESHGERAGREGQPDPS
jgi:hypothetical protein